MLRVVAHATAIAVAALSHQVAHPAGARSLAGVQQVNATMVVDLRRGIRWQRSRTWHWQELAGARRTPTRYRERHTWSVEFLRWMERTWSQRRVAARHRYLAVRSSSNVPAVICQVFRGQCSVARAVAWCESKYRTAAVNGQYLGIFQLGSHERAMFATAGYANAYEQTVAAHNYYDYEVGHGRWGWSPWSCA